VAPAVLRVRGTGLPSRCTRIAFVVPDVAGGLPATIVT
jgi:hypothetical protein